MTFISMLAPTSFVAAITACSVVASPLFAPQAQEQLKKDPDKVRVKGEQLLDEGIRSVEISPTAIKSLQEEARVKDFIVIKDFPLADGSSTTLDMRKKNPISPGAMFIRQRNSNPESASRIPLELPDDMIILTGKLRGDADSFAMMAFSDKGSFGFIDSAKGRTVLSSGKIGSKLKPVIYDPAVALGGFLQVTDWTCETDTHDRVIDVPAEPRNGQGGLASGIQSCKVVSIALEYDFEFWNNSLGADAGTALYYTVAMIASLDEIFRRDTGVGLTISNLRVWEEADDPWTGVDTQEQLDELATWYGENGDDIVRDTVMLCSGRLIGGGRAELEALCTDEAFAVSGGMNGFFPYPLEETHGNNWDIYVMAHELGHNLGAIHTHEFCPPLDRCADEDFFGSCQPDRNCSEGTIMSYCHTCAGGVNNVRMRFHPTVAQTITDFVNAADCILDDEDTIQAADDSAETLMNTKLFIDVLDNDRSTCSEPTILAHDEGSAEGGKVSTSMGTGPFGRDRLEYLPPTGFIGLDAFSYIALNDAGQIELATVTVEVMPQEQVTDLLVADVMENAIHRYHAETGVFLGTLVPDGEGGLDLPQKACLGPGGDVIVANFKTDHVIRFDPVTGESLGVFYGGDLIDGPVDLAFDFNTVYVAAKFAEQVVMVKASGNVGFVLDVGHGPNQILLDEPADRLYVAYGSTSSERGVQIWSTATKELLDSFQTPHVTNANGLCRLPDGDFLVCDWYGQRIARYDGTSFAFEGWFMDSNQSAPDQFNVVAPTRMLIGPNGRLHVTSWTGIHRFNVNGQYIDQIDSTESELLGQPQGMFFRPPGIVAGDLNGDGGVDGADLAILLGDWGGPGPGDLNRDGIIDGTDLATLLGNWR